MQSTNSGEVHVVPYREAWAVEALGIKYVEFATQELALDFGRLQAEKKQAPLIVHDRDGEIVKVVQFTRAAEQSAEGHKAGKKKGVQAA